MRRLCFGRPRLRASPRAGRCRRNRTNQIAWHNDRQWDGSRPPGRDQPPSRAHGFSSPDDSFVVLSMWMLMRLDDTGQIVVAVRVRLEVQFTGAHMFDPMHPLLNAAGCLARNLKDGRVVIEPAEIAAELLKVEIGVRYQIRLVVAFGHAEDADLYGLTKIELGGARDITDILNEQQIDLIQIQFGETSL